MVENDSAQMAVQRVGCAVRLPGLDSWLQSSLATWPWVTLLLKLQPLPGKLNHVQLFHSQIQNLNTVKLVCCPLSSASSTWNPRQSCWWPASFLQVTKALLIPSQGLHGILKCFSRIPDISTSLCCFSPHHQVAARFPYSAWPLLQRWLESNSGPLYFGSSSNASGISIISHLQGHQNMKYLLGVLQHFNFRFFYCRKLKCYLLWVKKLLTHHPSFFPTLLNCQALALDM